MTIYIWIVLALYVVSTMYSPYMVGKSRDKHYPFGQMIGLALALPVFGRALGWW